MLKLSLKWTFRGSSIHLVLYWHISFITIQYLRPSSITHTNNISKIETQREKDEILSFPQVSWLLNSQLDRSKPHRYPYWSRGFSGIKLFRKQLHSRIFPTALPLLQKQSNSVHQTGASLEHHQSHDTLLDAQFTCQMRCQMTQG